MSCPGDNYVVPGANPNNTPVFIGTYYKSFLQNLVTGATDITFDLTAPYNNIGGYISHTNGTKDFIVQKTGLYQLEWNATINGGTSTATSLLRQISIDIARSPLVETVTIAQNASIPTASNYGQSVSATFYLVAGDVINCRVVYAFTGIASIVAISSIFNFDYNTWFSWRFIT